MQPGTTISGRFLLEHEVASGGGGRVFRAVDTTDGRLVAVKFLLSLDAQGIARFQREALLLARLSHPGLLRYVAHGAGDGGVPWLATEWLEGEDLRRHLARGADEPTTVTVVHPIDATHEPRSRRGVELDATRPSAGTLPIGELLTLLRRMASALSALHEEGLVHRDVKPSNIVLVGGRVAQSKLIDLGAARGVLTPGDLTRTGHLVGTPTYMAPEQARGSLQITAAVDVWALGCVAYECLRGQSPFKGSDATDTLARIQFDEPLSLFGRRSDVPELLAGLIHRMLRKDPRDRPRDGAAVLEELELFGAPEIEVRGDTIDTSLGGAEQRVGCALEAELRGDASDETPLTALAASFGVRPVAVGERRWIVRMPHTVGPTDQAERAARFALRLRDAVGPWAIAITTGPQPSTRTDAEGRMARDLLERAADGSATVDVRTASLLEARFTLERCEPGYRLASARDTETVRTFLGRPTRTVGRRRELGLLDATWSACAEEQRARVVLVTAAPGVGKSRLRWEFLRAVERRGEPHLNLELRGDSMSAGSSFATLAPGLRRAARISEHDDATSARAKLVALARAALEPPTLAERVAALLGELVGLPFEDAYDESLRAARSDPMLLAERMSWAFVTWLQAEARRAPVLVVVDDLHWSDRPSISFVDAALRTLRDAPLLVVALARPEVHDAYPSLWSAHAVDHIRLDPLGKRAATELVRDALDRELPEAELDALVERSAGNALYLEELLRALVEEGVEARSTLPETVIGMVQARLGAMGPEPRRILRAASTFGEAFWVGGLRQLVGETTGEFSLADWLDELARRELVTRADESKFPGEIEYRFRHALVRESAYALLTEEDRAKAHRLAAQWLERKGERDARLLASHFDRGDLLDDAGRWYARAAESAIEGSDLESALDAVARARTCGLAGEARGAVDALGAVALYWQSRYRESANDGLAALEQTARGSTPWFQACGTTLVSLARLGDFDAFDPLFDRLKAADATDETAAAQLVALCRGAFQLVFKGRFADADDVLARIAERTAEARSLDALTQAQVRHVQGVRAAMVGDVGEFLHHLQAAVASFDRAGDVKNVCLERTTVGWCHAELGRYDEAIARIRANLDECQRLKAQQAITYAKVNLGYALERARGHEDEADQVLRAAIRETAAVKNQRLEGWARAHLASLALRRGDPSLAEQEARQSCAMLRNAPSLYGWSLSLWARAMLRLGRTRIALDAAEEAMRLLDEVGGLLQGNALPPLVLAEVLDARGQREAARRAAIDANARLDRRVAALRDPDWRATFLAVDENVDTRAVLARLALDDR